MCAPFDCLVWKKKSVYGVHGVSCLFGFQLSDGRSSTAEEKNEKRHVVGESGGRKRVRVWFLMEVAAGELNLKEKATGLFEGNAVIECNAIWVPRLKPLLFMWQLFLDPQ